MIDPIAVRIGPLELHWYGIIIASAVLVAALLGTWVARFKGENHEHGWGMLLLVVVLAVLGARIYHVIHEWDVYSQQPALIPQVWRGGIGIPGALIGGAVGIAFYTWRNGLSTARWLDIFAPAVLLGQAIGRLGNFVNQELYGPPTSLPWGIPIDAEHRIGEWMDLSQYPVDTTRFHPLFAYEALLNLAGMGLILLLMWRLGRRLYDGDMALMYMVWYGGVRSYLETFRTDNWTIGGIPTAMWLGIAAVMIGGGWLILRHLKGWGTPAPVGRDRGAADGATTAQAAEPSPG
ncbi:MAG TPA: prolipoprotein diacylglyceryl transferase [Candidatus Limnocylindria bacterium]|nr:prolipoprotein diacylglyceryl transferase [Candidatus Limnocylindria bacterium]